MRPWLLLTVLLATQAWADPLSPSRFLDDSLPWHEPAGRAVDVQHLDLTVTLDPAGAIAGHAIYAGVLRQPTKEVRLYAVDFAIDEAAWLVDGKRVATTPTRDHETLHFALPQTEPPGAWQLELKWHAKPKRGLNFVQPDADAPQRPQHVWSQGETEEARYWLPSPDDPDERLSWNVTIVAPATWQALSNGVQLSRAVTDQLATTAYALHAEAPIYLLTIAAGPFIAVEHPHPQTPLVTWALPDVLDDMRRSFAVTPDILDKLNALTGMAYPWGRYGHVVVGDFSFGGMENVSLTTLTDRAMPDVREALDWQVDSLIAHEMAHQWFGDWLTCRTWADIWLNEGFASYFDLLTTEKRLGRARFDEDLADARASYLTEAAEYVRPIVTDRYRDADELFDRHTYQKGALVLHMLRRQLGDKAFFAGIAAYLKAGARSVETADFQRAMEDASGKSLRGFFTRWLRQAGHPALHAKVTWDEAQKTLKIALEQKQKISHSQPAFDLQIPLRIQTPEAVVLAAVHLDGVKADYTLVATARPTVVEIDPEFTLLADWTLEADIEDVVAMRDRGSSAEARLRAVTALGKQLASQQAVTALLRTLAEDPARHVRAAAAEQLGKAERPTARAGLLAALVGDPESLVRAAAALALGELHDLAAWPQLVTALHKDPSYAVVRGAMTALHKIDRQAARDLLRETATVASHRDTLAVHALSLLGQTGDVRDANLLWQLAQPGNGKPLREGALPALAAWAVRNEPQREKVRLFLESVLHEPNLRLRQRAAEALGVLGEPASRGPLLAAADREVFFRTAEMMRKAAGELGHKTPVEERIRRLEEQLEKLQREPHGKPAEGR